jgi:hypothetical protein
LQNRLQAVEEMPFKAHHQLSLILASVPMTSSAKPCFSNTCGKRLDFNFVIIQSKGKSHLCPLEMSFSLPHFEQEQAVACDGAPSREICLSCTGAGAGDQCCCQISRLRSK